MRHLLLVVSMILTLCSCLTVSAQVLQGSLQGPEELLDKYLLYADEVSQCFCVKIDGQQSIAGKEFDLYILSAKCASKKARYTAYGLEELGSGREVFFEERMHVGDRILYKVGQGFNNDTRPADAQKKDNDGNLVPRKVSFVDNFDPLALVLTTSSSISGNKVQIDLVRDRLLSSKLVASHVEKDGKVSGEFLVKNKYSVVQIEFDPKVDYFPVTTKVYLFDIATGKKASAPFAVTQTEWARKSEKMLLPSRMKLEYRDATSRQDDEFKFAWADCEAIRDKIDFEQLAVLGKKVDWQGTFLKIVPGQ